MSVFQRKGSPYFYAEFEIDGHRFCRSTKTTTRRDAERVEKRLKEEEREKLKTASQKPSLTLDQAFGRYWKEQSRKLSVKWAAEVARYSAEIIRIMPPELTITEMHDGDVNDYVQARVAEGGGDYAINRALAVWRRVHNVASKIWKQKTQVIDWTAFMNAEAKRVSEKSEAEIRDLMGHLSPTLALAVEWSVYTGCRREETFELTWDRVFFDKGYATVIAKGSREHRVWLTPNVLDVLARCDRRGRYVFERRNWRKVWEAGLRNAGFHNFRFHDLRHVHATWLRQQGAPIEVVQRSLGHADIQTTMRYAHVADRELQEALHRLPSISTNTTSVVSIFATKTKA